MISQEIDADSKVEEGSTINYVISDGPETVSYTVKFTGAITNAGYDFEAAGNVSVTVSYTIGDAFHQRFIRGFRYIYGYDHRFRRTGCNIKL